MDPRAKACREGYRKALGLAKKELNRRNRELAKVEAARAKLDAAEEGRCSLPAVVFRDGTVKPVSYEDAIEILEHYLTDLCLDTETSGYWVGHRYYELRTVQLGGEEMAVVFDAACKTCRMVVEWALHAAERVWAHSATADAIPCVVAGLITWDAIWSKMHDSVIRAKLTDPKLCGSEADKLKDLARDLLREYAVSPKAEEAKDKLFSVMKCLKRTDNTTPPERNGWHQVNKFAVVMIRYAGSDVLDLAAVLRVLPPLPVGADVMERERITQMVCARAAMDGFPLDADHIDTQIEAAEEEKKISQLLVEALTEGKITNPSASADVLEYLQAKDYQLKLNRKSKMPTAGKESLEPLAARGDALAENIVRYRGSVTKLGLLLRPLKNLCTHGDSIMRPTVYTINAKTGRMSCVRPNGQQFSRQGGVRACVRAGEFYLMLLDGQWQVVDSGGVLTPMRGISADFEGCEIRVAAAISGDRGLYEAETSTQCRRCGEWVHEDEGQWCACGEGKAHLGLHWLTAHTAHGEGATKEHRYQAKRGTFTRLFGGGPNTAADQVGCEVELMYKVWDAFDSVAPVYTWWDQCMRQWFDSGTRTWRDYSTGTNFSQDIPGDSRHLIYQTYSGRNVYITNGQHAAGNGAIQGTARELLVDGLIKWSRTRWGRLPLLPVHDQIICLVPADEAQIATRALADCMSTDILSSPGFPVHIGVDTDEPFVNWPDSS